MTTYKSSIYSRACLSNNKQVGEENIERYKTELGSYQEQQHLSKMIHFVPLTLHDGRTLVTGDDKQKCTSRERNQKYRSKEEEKSQNQASVKKESKESNFIPNKRDIPSSICNQRQATKKGDDERRYEIFQFDVTFTCDKEESAIFTGFGQNLERSTAA